ncbi:NAD-dependent epimerase/dehydratase family protein [Salinibacter ruber]|uniref:NAD-dependent epimerase/dehydratase family protein n=1 Tax=Salinibacter ruber TaxID=146919 RepID=UPI002169060D|nr:NAD-dependent epimerase/dehydratase family protein [Salinibacter ruber]MCS4150710.1 nucleoside-diphosphate-sugar epimerase [Salinibacter ruber]
MKALVTGGLGFIGSHLSRKLVAGGHDVTVFDNESRGSTGRLEEVSHGVNFVRGDIRSKEALKEVKEEFDVIFHLAAVNGTKAFYERPAQVLDVNVTGTKNVVELAREMDVDRLVFTSSSEVYGFPREFPTPESHPLQIMDNRNPRYSYAGSKILGEQYVIHGAEKENFEYTIVRPHNLYGPDMGYDHVIPEFIERLVREKKFTIYGDGSQTRSFCYISDAVDAITTSATQSEASDEIYNVGTQKEVTINELATKLFEVAGYHPEVTHIESKELEGSPDRRQPDVSKAKEHLNYVPTVSLRDGLRRTFDAYCQDLIGESAKSWRSS